MLSVMMLEYGIFALLVHSNVNCQQLRVCDSYPSQGILSPSQIDLWNYEEKFFSMKGSQIFNRTSKIIVLPFWHKLRKFLHQSPIIGGRRSMYIDLGYLESSSTLFF